MRPFAALCVGWVAYAAYYLAVLSVFIGLPVATVIWLGGWFIPAIAG